MNRDRILYLTITTTQTVHISKTNTTLFLFAFRSGLQGHSLQSFYAD